MAFLVLFFGGNRKQTCLHGTAQQNSAIFAQEGSATWDGGCVSGRAARTGGAARHAGQCAESGAARSSGVTRRGAELPTARSRPLSRTREDGTTANRCVWDDWSLARMARVLGPSSCMWSCRHNETRAWWLGSVNEPIGRSNTPAGAGGLLEGGLNIRSDSQPGGSRPENDLAAR